MAKILVTGAAGFIGYHVSNALLGLGHQIIGIDNYSDYYDVTLKQARVHALQTHQKFEFIKLDITNRKAVDALFEESKFDAVINLAAQPGVRYSIENPYIYVATNIEGFVHILEAAHRTNVEHVIYASSSSVYGTNKEIPFSEIHAADHPVSMYAATKRANELMAHSYSHIHGLRTTGLRFFTVYGPWGRPDMAVFAFAKAISEGKVIDVYNHGRMKRDFTYIDDIVSGVIACLNPIKAVAGEQGSNVFRIYNLGGSAPVELEKVIGLLERFLGKQANRNYLSMQLGDVKETYADISLAAKDLGFNPTTSVESGIEKFITWYRRYYDA